MSLLNLFTRKKKNYKKELIWFGPVFSYSGYAEHNRQIIFQLLEHNWKIRLIPSEKHIPEHLIGKNILTALTKNTDLLQENTICLNLIPPPALPYWGKYTVLYTTLESLTVHEGFLKRCLQYDEVWCPCLTNYQSLLRAGIKSKYLKYCPEGVDSKRFNPSVAPSRKHNKNYFTFLFNGDWSFRKGIDLLFTAYLEEFTRNENVRLLVFSRYQGNDDKKAVDRLQQELAEFKERHYKADLPLVEIISNSVPDHEVPGIFTSADCFVLPTRGEAWGLPISQALASGIPAITADWGGQMTFCTKENSFLIETEKFDTIDDKINCAVDFYKGQQFCFPSVISLKEQMRLAFTNRNLTKEKGYVARKDMVEKWGWEKAGNTANSLLCECLERIKRL
jgi:hypothetical protein